MGDLSCEVGATLRTKGEVCATASRVPVPVVSAYGGVYRCAACEAAYIAAGGSIYSEAQLARFAQIEVDYQARVARGEVPAGFRRT